jgi:uncharacterized protein (DUF433 family)
MLTADPTTHIYLDEEKVAYIDRTRHKVLQVACDHARNGWSAEQIVAQYPDLSLAQVHAALAYYFDHQEEIDGQIEERARNAEVLRGTLEDQATVDRLRRTKAGGQA